ncbi:MULTISPECIES: response regulator [Corallococcus]|uniref:response regulator n=1 Tax=Corallococcus TaxID=83461 RepID=UPI001180FD67|nr:MULTISPECIES: response regulator [Corallococcus]NBD09748.1 response regulator [Corallococcus silvisoli]TSC24020.1 response regulator [Corallococcus sp. Z5C101001]
MSRPLLVVDDDTDLREALEEVLRDAGYTVLGASNGLQALEVLRRQEPAPALVLLDMMMPVMDGATFGRQMREVDGWRDIPVLVFSASANARQVAEEMGACGYLRKPVDVDTLLKAVAANKAPEAS